MKMVIQLLMAAVGSLGFSMLFNVRSKYLLLASVGGLVSWAIYLVCHGFGAGLFLSSFFASVFCQSYAEVFSRVCKAPRTIFSIAAVVPLIPGSSLYYTMQSATMSDWAEFSRRGLELGYFALGIAAGLSLITALVTMHSNIKNSAK